MRWRLPIALVRSKRGAGGVTMAGRVGGKAEEGAEVGDDRRGPPVSRRVGVWVRRAWLRAELGRGVGVGPRAVAGPRCGGAWAASGRARGWVLRVGPRTSGAASWAAS